MNAVELKPFLWRRKRLSQPPASKECIIYTAKRKHPDSAEVGITCISSDQPLLDRVPGGPRSHLTLIGPVIYLMLNQLSPHSERLVSTTKTLDRTSLILSSRILIGQKHGSAQQSSCADPVPSIQRSSLANHLFASSKDRSGWSYGT